ncbi:MAG: iron transporter [Lachnospiraceae bacterium]|nr:iron transporter [Lachnospiraceae bacterium]
MRIRRYLTTLLCAAAMAGMVMAGCGNSGGSSGPAPETAAAETVTPADSRDASGHPGTAPLEDGTYTARFETGSTMFYVNEEDHGTGVLTVENGEMTIHIRLVSKSIVNLFCGTMEDAQAEGAELLEPTVETVQYSDGTSGDVNAFDVPVPYLDEPFLVSIIGTHGNWYEHDVTVSLAEDETEPVAVADLEDGVYDLNIAMEGGSGRAAVTSPSTLTVADGAGVAVIEWSSPNYDYMVVDGEKYYPVNEDGNSVFEIPVETLGVPVDVVGDTTAMSTPHEIEYTLIFTIG